MPAQKPSPKTYMKHVKIDAPLARAIDAVIEEDRTTASEFIRRTLLAEVRRRGFEPNHEVAA